MEYFALDSSNPFWRPLNHEISSMKKKIYSSSAQTFIALNPLMMSPTDYDLVKHRVIKKIPLKRTSSIFITNGNYVTFENGRPVIIGPVKH